MGARVEKSSRATRKGSSLALLTSRVAPSPEPVIEGSEVPNVIDELPVLAVAGALAQGTTIIRDAKELRFKETDRIAAIAANLRAMGVEVHEADDGMTIYGGGGLNGATLPSFGDHRIAMAFAIAGLFASGSTIIEDVGDSNILSAVRVHFNASPKRRSHAPPSNSGDFLTVGKAANVPILRQGRLPSRSMARPLQERAALREGFRSGSDFLTSTPVRSIVRSPGGSCAATRTPRRQMMSPRSLLKANSSRDSKATRRFCGLKGLIRGAPA